MSIAWSGWPGGGGGGGNAFGIVQPITGTSPTAASSADTLTFVSGDSSMQAIGTAASKQIDLRTAGTAPTLDTGWSFDSITSPTENNVTYWVTSQKVLHVEGHFIVGSVAGTAFSINIPSGVGAIKSSVYSSTSNSTQVGFATRGTASSAWASAANGPFPLFYDGSTTDKIFLCITTAATAFSKSNGTAFIGAGQFLQFKFEVALA